MMTSHTVEQLLQVFHRFRDNHASGIPLRPAYHQAVRSVAQAYSVTYQTIGDGCRRRLLLNEINELYDLLAAWVKGDPEPLARQLQENSEHSAHGQINKFFSGHQTFVPERPRTSAGAAGPNEPETISFQLPSREARMLRALAELEGVAVDDLAANTVSTAIRNRMADYARGIIQDSEMHP